MRLSILLGITLFLSFSCQEKKGEYVCTPCDLPCDDLSFGAAGYCPHCNMKLIKRSEVIPVKELILNEVNIHSGSGKILVDGGFQIEKSIIVHYYKAEKFTSESAVIIIVPGAGRNGDDYRDAWIEKAEEYNLLVLSPEYSEKNYPEFWSYNLAGMITNVKINAAKTAMTDFDISENPEEWIYNDFDRIFNLIKKELALNTDSYDMFGHSAGGQVLHRLAIFKPQNKASRILAANSGWYTVPTDNDEFPYGLEKSNRSSVNVDFSSELIIFLGEKDDANETRGDLRHSPEVDKQGLYRLARGKHFYTESKRTASEMNTNFNWKIKIVPDVGHDYRGMSNAAANYLYGVPE